MEKIEFKNGESPYLSAENLNKIQDNVENAIKSAETNSNEGISSLQESIDVELTKKLNKTDKATPAETIQGTDNNKYTTPLAIKSAIEKALEGYEPGTGGTGGGDTFPMVEDSLESNSKTNAPSVHAVKEALKLQVIKNVECETNEIVDGKRKCIKYIEFKTPSVLNTWTEITTIPNLYILIDVQGSVKKNTEAYPLKMSFNGEEATYYFNHSSKKLFYKVNYDYISNTNAVAYITYLKEI